MGMGNISLSDHDRQQGARGGFRNSSAIPETRGQEQGRLRANGKNALPAVCAERRDPDLAGDRRKKTRKKRSYKERGMGMDRGWSRDRPGKKVAEEEKNTTRRLVGKCLHRRTGGTSVGLETGREGQRHLHGRKNKPSSSKQRKRSGKL